VGRFHRQTLSSLPSRVRKVFLIVPVCVLLFVLFGIPFLWAQTDKPEPQIAGPGWHQAVAEAVSPQ
jgi:hypothetical protein